jgi:hypothetical protein
MRFIVGVDFGAVPTRTTTRALEAKATAYGATVIPIDTSRDLFLRDGGHVNEAFEFSGYQYGLEQVLAAAASSAADARIAVAFVNGTALTSHVRVMLRHCLRRAFEEGRRGGGATLNGFKHACEGPKALVATRGYYVPTFAFALSGTLLQLEGVTLYDRAVLSRTALAERYGRAGREYCDAIDAWLSPCSWLAGWYQALPNRPLDVATRYRKSLAIYSEHAMVTWLAMQGVEIHAEGACEQWMTRALMSLDRAYVNMLKLRYRLVALRRP